MYSDENGIMCETRALMYLDSLDADYYGVRAISERYALIKKELQKDEEICVEDFRKILQKSRRTSCRSMSDVKRECEAAEMGM